MLQRLKDRLASPLLGQKLLIAVFLPLVFFVPMLKLVALWPGEDGPLIWKVLTLTLAPASLFLLWALYLYSVARLTERERALEKSQ